MFDLSIREKVAITVCLLLTSRSQDEKLDSIVDENGTTIKKVGNAAIKKAIGVFAPEVQNDPFEQNRVIFCNIWPWDREFANALDSNHAMWHFAESRGALPDGVDNLTMKGINAIIVSQLENSTKQRLIKSIEDVALFSPAISVGTRFKTEDDAIIDRLDSSVDWLCE